LGRGTDADAIVATATVRSRSSVDFKRSETKRDDGKWPPGRQAADDLEP
jgi:hypothetical protein